MIEEIKKEIDLMSHEDMAKRWRFSKIGDPIFQGETGDYFIDRFKILGGFTPTISKRIGWDI